MMGIVVPETYSAYKKYNIITSGIYLVFYSSVITMMHGPTNIKLLIHSVIFHRWNPLELTYNFFLLLLLFPLCTCTESDFK